MNKFCTNLQINPKIDGSYGITGKIPIVNELLEESFKEFLKKFFKKPLDEIQKKKQNSKKKDF